MKLRFSAVLLAGGKSSRMGTDKALLEIDGQPLWQRQMGILRELGAQEIFLSGSIEGEGFRTIQDARANAGPLGGLVTSLQQCSTSLLVVLAVDLPQMSASFLCDLLGECSRARGVIPQSGQCFEPLAAIYPKAAQAVAEARLESTDYSLQPFCRECVDQGLVRLRAVLENQKALFRNINTPADWAGVTIPASL